MTTFFKHAEIQSEHFKYYPSQLYFLLFISCQFVKCFVNHNHLCLGYILVSLNVKGQQKRELRRSLGWCWLGWDGEIILLMEFLLLIFPVFLLVISHKQFPLQGPVFFAASFLWHVSVIGSILHRNTPVEQLEMQWNYVRASIAYNRDFIMENHYKNRGFFSEPS